MPDVKFSTVALADVFLDNENPRHNPVDDERQIIAKLVAQQKITNLAASLAIHGPSPLERMAVIRHPSQQGKFTIIEGNRRLCALKLLWDPRRAPNVTLRKAIEMLRARAQVIPNRIEVAVFADRQSARYWLSLRHEGEQRGVGTRSWKATEKARFKFQRSPGSPRAIPNAQAVALLDYAQAEDIISEAVRKNVPLTAITRYLSSPVVRSILGLVNNRDLTIEIYQNEFDVVVARLLSDVVSGRAHLGDHSEDRKKYALALHEEGVGPTTRLATPVIVVPHAPGVTAMPAPNSRDPKRRPFIVPLDFSLKAKDPVLQRLFDELSTFDPEDCPFWGAYLLDAFVEKVAFLFAKQCGHATLGLKLEFVIDACCTELRKDGVSEKELEPLLVVSTNIDHLACPDSLGAGAHGNMINSVSGLKFRWDYLSPGLQLMLSRMK